MAAERKGKKLRRCAKHAGHYKAQFFTTEKNHKRRLVRHIKNHPSDAQASARFDAGMGESKGIGMTARGARRARHALGFV